MKKLTTPRNKIVNLILPLIKISVIGLFALVMLNFTVINTVHADRAEDEKAIRAHIDKIFQAYIKKDRATVKATHSVHWRGFLSESNQVVRGIDGYMKVVDNEGDLKQSNSWHMASYKMLDYDIVFNGQTGIVLYVAEVFWEDGASKGSFKLRSVDIFGKEKGKWIQIACNTGRLPQANN